MCEAEMKAIAYQAMFHLGIDKSKLKRLSIVKVNKGRCDWKNGVITMPLWVTERCYTFQVAYVIHEVCHFLITGHRKDFKALENKALGYFGLRATHGRKYANAYYHGDNYICNGTGR